MQTATARQGKTAGIPFRQQRAPAPLPLPLGCPIEQVAAAIAARVQEIGRARSCCAYAFVRDGLVYVLSEESGSAHRWAIEHTAEWVGCYGGLVDQVRLAEDLADFLR